MDKWASERPNLQDASPSDGICAVVVAGRLWLGAVVMGLLLAIGCTQPSHIPLSTSVASIDQTPTPSLVAPTIPTETSTLTPVPTAGPVSTLRIVSTPTRTPTSVPVAPTGPAATFTPTSAVATPESGGQLIIFPEAIFEVEKAVSSEERSIGLMGREHLGEQEGMLFIFEEEQPLRFWMKGMLIPLDMVWIDGSGVVAGVTTNVPPAVEGTDPEIYSPPRPVQYVLEINAGLAEASGIDVGSQARFVPELAD